MGYWDELLEFIFLGVFGCWMLIGFFFYLKDGFMLYRFSVEGGRVIYEIKVLSNNDEWKLRLWDMLYLMYCCEFFKENWIEYDDFCVYIGWVKNNIFIDAYKCDALGV